MSKEQAEKYLPKPIAMRDYEITKTIGKGEFSIVKLAKLTEFLCIIKLVCTKKTAISKRNSCFIVSSIQFPKLLRKVLPT